MSGRNLRDCFISPLEVVRVLKPRLKPESSVVIISGVASAYYIPAYANSNVLRVMWSAEIKNLAAQLAPQKVPAMCFHLGSF